MFHNYMLIKIHCTHLRLTTCKTTPPWPTFAFRMIIDGRSLTLRLFSIANASPARAMHCFWRPSRPREQIFKARFACAGKVTVMEDRLINLMPYSHEMLIFNYSKSLRGPIMLIFVIFHLHDFSDNHGQNYSDKRVKYKEFCTISKISSKNPPPVPPSTMLVSIASMTITLLTLETATLYQGGGDATIL